MRNIYMLCIHKHLYTYRQIYYTVHMYIFIHIIQYILHILHIYHTYYTYYTYYIHLHIYTLRCPALEHCAQGMCGWETEQQQLPVGWSCSRTRPESSFIACSYSHYKMLWGVLFMMLGRPSSINLTCPFCSWDILVRVKIGVYIYIIICNTHI